jgi:hypothetical protein
MDEIEKGLILQGNSMKINKIPLKSRNGPDWETQYEYCPFLAA